MLTIFRREITQPIFDYSSGTPQFADSYRIISYSRHVYKITLLKGTGIPFIVTMGLKKLAIVIPTPVTIGAAINESLRVRDHLQVHSVDLPAKSEYGPDGQLRPAPYRSTWAHPCGPANPLRHGCP